MAKDVNLTDCNVARILNYSPHCCPEHQSIPKRKYLLHTKRWQFPQKDEFSKQAEMNYRFLGSSAARKKQNEEEKIEAILEEIRLKNFTAMLKSCLDLKSAENVAEILGITLPPDEVEQEQEKDIKEEQISFHSAATKTKNVTGIHKFLKSRKIENKPDSANMYGGLLKRIEKSEKEKKKADPEALAYKLVEEKLDDTAEKFCRWTSCLILPDQTNDNEDSLLENRNAQMAIKPQKLREMFKIDLCQSNLCPYIPHMIQEAREMPKLAQGKQKVQKNVPPPQQKDVQSDVESKKLRCKLAYYVPPKKWFGSSVKTDTHKLTEEEEDFIKSFGFKQFMKYLNEKGETPPKAFVKLKEKYTEQVRKARINERMSER